MKIAQLSTYPIKSPRHGGQVRVSQMANFLRLQGHSVRSFSLCEPTHQAYGSDDFVVMKRDLAKLSLPPCVYDYAMSHLAIKEPYYEPLKSKIMEFAPDVVMIEQMWLYPLYKALYGDCEHKPILIYSSHNIEHRMKAELLKALEIENENLIADIKQLESDLCAHADWAIACTPQDREGLLGMGAKNVIVCANGVEKIQPKSSTIQLLTQLIAGRSYALFVGSAHIPNALGFWEMLSSDLSYLKPHQIIIVVGSVSHILKQHAPKGSHFNRLVMDEKIKLLGEVSEEALAALLQQASVLLLPITLGGGSNLKTAEAIIANRPTVATKTAIRGFEFASKLNQFVVVERQEDFIQALKQAFITQPTPSSKADMEARGSLYWGLTLEPLHKLLQSLQEKLPSAEAEDKNPQPTDSTKAL